MKMINKRRFLTASFIGYGYLLFIISVFVFIFLFAVALSVVSHRSVVAIKIALFSLVPLVLIIKSLLPKIPPPTGRVLLPMEAPALFHLIEYLRKQLKAGRIYQVIITSTFNASVIQHSRLGIFGGNRNYLLIGLPLLETLSLDQFKSVLAHELAHISNNHGKSSLWAYRLTSSWNVLSEKFEGTKSVVGWMFKPFFKKYRKYYERVSNAYFRDHEFECDALAAKIVGAAQTALALLRIHLMGEAVQLFWEDLEKRVQTQDLPPKDVYIGSIKYMRDAMLLDHSNELISKMMSRHTMELDSHPSIKDRLTALKYNYKNSKIVHESDEELSFREKFDVTAADNLINKDLVDQWHRGLTDEWDADYKKEWYAKREQYYAQQERYQQLKNKPDLTLQAQFDRAKAAEDLNLQDEAFKDYEDLVRKNFKVGTCQLLSGKILLDKKDARGIPLIEDGMKLETEYCAWGAWYLYRYFETLGNASEAERWYKKYLDYLEVDRLDHLQRSQVLSTDHFIAHEAEESLIALIQQRAQDCKDVSQVYFARKKVGHHTYKSVYICLFVLKRKFFKHFFSTKSYYDEYQNYFLGLEWPVKEYFYLTTNLSFKRPLAKIKDALIFKRG